VTLVFHSSFHTILFCLFCLPTFHAACLPVRFWMDVPIPGYRSPALCGSSCAAILLCRFSAFTVAVTFFTCTHVASPSPCWIPPTFHISCSHSSAFICYSSAFSPACFAIFLLPTVALYGGSPAWLCTDFRLVRSFRFLLRR